MPDTQVRFYCEKDGTAPVVEWLTELSRRNRKAAEKCLVRIETLRRMGYELRRPIADVLRDGIYELRTRHGTVQCGILYFYHGQNVAILAHALTKEKKVPQEAIDEAIRRQRRFERAPEEHTYREEIEHGDNN